MPNACGLAVTGPAGFNDDDVISLNRSLTCFHVPPLAEKTVGTVSDVPAPADCNEVQIGGYCGVRVAPIGHFVQPYLNTFGTISSFY